MWAGAHVRPIPASTAQLRREAPWLRRTVAEFERHARDPSCGVTPTLGVEFLDTPDDAYVSQTATQFTAETGLRGYKRLSEVPDGVALGFQYETYCLNSPIYCASLLRKFLLRGGKTLHKDLRSEDEAFALGSVALVVNASGIGFGDRNMFPTRGTLHRMVECLLMLGQTVVTDLPVTRTVTRQHKDGTWSFLIPRFLNGGTIVGGTKEPNDWRATACEKTRNTLLAGGAPLVQYANGQADSIGVVSDLVGRRPTRHGGVRLELEQRDVAGRQRKIVHAYGVGGRGYELSWGIADEVASLVQQALPPAAKL